MLRFGLGLLAAALVAVALVSLTSPDRVEMASNVGNVKDQDLVHELQQHLAQHENVYDLSPAEGHGDLHDRQLDHVIQQRDGELDVMHGFSPRSVDLARRHHLGGFSTHQQSLAVKNPSPFKTKEQERNYKAARAAAKKAIHNDAKLAKLIKAKVHGGRARHARPQRNNVETVKSRRQEHRRTTAETRRQEHRRRVFHKQKQHSRPAPPPKVRHVKHPKFRHPYYKEGNQQEKRAHRAWKRVRTSKEIEGSTVTNEVPARETSRSNGFAKFQDDSPEQDRHEVGSHHHDVERRHHTRERAERSRRSVEREFAPQHQHTDRDQRRRRHTTRDDARDFYERPGRTMALDSLDARRRRSRWARRRHSASRDRSQDYRRSDRRVRRGDDGDHTLLSKATRMIREAKKRIRRMFIREGYSVPR